MSGCRLVSENALPDRNYQVSSSKRIGMSRPLLRSVGAKIGVKGRSQIGDIQSSSRCRRTAWGPTRDPSDSPEGVEGGFCELRPNSVPRNPTDA